MQSGLQLSYPVDPTQGSKGDCLLRKRAEGGRRSPLRQYVYPLTGYSEPPSLSVLQPRQLALEVLLPVLDFPQQLLCGLYALLADHNNQGLQLSIVLLDALPRLLETVELVLNGNDHIVQVLRVPGSDLSQQLPLEVVVVPVDFLYCFLTVPLQHTCILFQNGLGVEVLSLTSRVGTSSLSS